MVKVKCRWCKSEHIEAVVSDKWGYICTNEPIERNPETEIEIVMHCLDCGKGWNQKYIGVEY